MTNHSSKVTISDSAIGHPFDCSCDDCDDNRTGYMLEAAAEVEVDYSNHDTLAEDHL